ncbi:unnamed protein product [Cyclocybe aegerita]|uniref:Uncharacterized protein n=1 Tax=Cyclocybe aegerita TaxID=1973307 RepID=A0A8S0VTU1_CYCAE|nr:unnamed protein product [Cyclocybe aegerita]
MPSSYDMTRHEAYMISTADDAQFQDRFVGVLPPEPFNDFDGVPADLEFFMPMGSTYTPGCSKSTIEWLSDCSLPESCPSTPSLNINRQHHQVQAKVKRGHHHVHFADIVDEEDEGDSPERPYLSLLDLGRTPWIPSPPGSTSTIDSDTDDSLSSSSSSLSPTYQDDAELRNTSDYGDQDDLPSVQCIYHPIEEYPHPHLDIYADEHEQGHKHEHKQEPDDGLPTLAISALSTAVHHEQLPFLPLSSPTRAVQEPGLQSDAETGHGRGPLCPLMFLLNGLRTSPPPSPLSMDPPLPSLNDIPAIAHIDTIDNVKPIASDLDAATLLCSPLQHSATLPPSPPSPSSLSLFQPYRPEHSFGWNNSFSFGLGSSLWEEEPNVPCSPSRRRSMDLPDEDPFRLTSSCPSTTSSLSFDCEISTLFFDQHDGQRATWLTLPGADSDDDLIPLALASKNYIPDPTITVSTTPSAPLLLFDDPADGDFSLASRRSSSPPDIDEFFVDPKVLEDLSLRGAKEEVEEAKKLVDLQQKTQNRCRMRARTRSLGGLGSNFGEYGNDGAGRVWDRWEKEREAKERERAREVAALLRLKLGLDERGCCVRAPGGGSGESLDVGTESEAGSTGEDDAPLAPPRSSTPASASAPASTPGALKARRASSLPIATSASIASPPAPSACGLSSSSDDPCSSNSSRSSSASSFSSMFDSTPASTATSRSSTDPSTNPTPTSPPPKRSSKPMITSMAQLVASMVFHRQQQADSARRACRTPSRSRTWAAPSLSSSPPSSSSPCGSSASTSSGQQEKNVGAKTPRSPLRQMILPDELAGNDEEESEDGLEGLDELELSPLSLGLLCTSPETYSAELGLNTSQL